MSEEVLAFFQRHKFIQEQYDHVVSLKKPYRCKGRINFLGMLAC